MPPALATSCRSFPCPELEPCPVHGRRAFEGAHQHGRKVPPSLKAQVMREETHCWICQQPGRADDQPDHVLPVSRGGQATRENLKRAHRTCNLNRGASLGRSRGKA